MALWKNKIYQHSRRVCNDDVFHHSVKGINIVKQGVEVHPDKIDKPKKIRYQKPFAKRNQIIKLTIHRIIIVHPIKPFHEHK